WVGRILRQRRSGYWRIGQGGRSTKERSSPDVLEVLAGLEANRAARRDAYFFARPGIAPDSAFARLHLKDAEAAQLDSLTALHGEPHRLEHRIDGHLGLDLGDIRHPRHLVDDVDL